MPTTLDKKIRKKIQREKHLGKNIHVPTSVDSNMKWVPLLAMWLLDITGMKTRNKWTKQILLVSASQAVRTLITKPVKKATEQVRPDSFRHNSFPSGHTSTAFAGAEILRMELKDNYPALSYTGYAAAATTAFLRLYNNKHWLSDVVAGAVIGVVSTRIVYFMLGRRKKSSPSNVDEKS